MHHDSSSSLNCYAIQIVYQKYLNNNFSLLSSSLISIIYSLKFDRWKGSPHLGTDNLVKLLRNMRLRLADLGGEIHFGTKMTNLKMEGSKVCGVVAEDLDGNEHYYGADEVVLATGHSARDVYESLHRADVKLEAKGFAVGFRIEHPQTIINKIQYGDEWGPCVKTGKGLTDKANEEYFGMKPEHIAKMPVPSYRLATDKAVDGVDGNFRGAYSFCMCPVSRTFVEIYWSVGGT